jgi:hypothetical protein
MSLKNPNMTKNCMGLPNAPLPAVFINMSLQQVLNGNQSGDQLQSWQTLRKMGYLDKYKLLEACQ